MQEKLDESNLDYPVRIVILHHFDGYSAHLKLDRSRVGHGRTEDEACHNLIETLLRDYELIKARNDEQLSAQDREYKSLLNSVFD